ncbi:unnamed protein product [Linum tenue]|uniref:Uncharacterized protein n=1 Tax=Linum tenue TaxID=586396 RepID=A0AAV0JR84_9ROSI|nr:unnamed protein product [Linum tenue]
MHVKPCGFQANYNFADSLSDTGNAMATRPGPEGWKYPMGNRRNHRQILRRPGYSLSEQMIPQIAAELKCDDSKNEL